MRALHTAATGMQSQQVNLDNISNNLANVSTTGFKRGRADFQDLIYQALAAAGASAETETPTGVQIGYGSRLASVQKLFTQGSFQATNQPLDVAVEGDGFFQISMPDGTLAYTRDGSFKLDSTGQIVTSNGYPLSTPITIPSDATRTIIEKDGTVRVEQPDGTQTVIGNFQLYKFVNAAGLTPLGHNLFLETSVSGANQAGTPGQQGYGTLTQGALELSNVSVVEELIAMIVSQRAYEVNSKAITTADEMMQTATQLKR
jgi:flagellar basal-body rod protein FlgG